MAELLSKQVGGTHIALSSEEQPHPIPDPGYDMPTTIFVVTVAHGYGDEEFIYADHDTALAVFNREVGYAAVLVAKQAMRIKAW